MAKFKPGPMIGSASGSVGGQTFSHNRFGAYIRTRAIPVKVMSTPAMAAKSRLIEASQAWGALTDAQRAAWRAWAQSNPVTDSLGEKQELDGHAAYVKINTRLLFAGLAKLSTPPSAVAPAAMTSFSATFDIGSGTTVLTFAATPLGATKYLWLQAAQVSNPGILYANNLLRLCAIGSANEATGGDYQARVEARIGSLVAGKKLILFASVFDGSTGLVSAPLRAEGAITAAA